MRDVDVIYISEIRDLETLMAAVTAAHVGHLVVTTVHGTSPEGIVERLVDAMAGDQQTAFRKQLAECLLVASVQLLLPLAGGKGRAAAYGVLVPDDQTRAAIAAGDSLSSRATQSTGSQTLADDIRTLRDQGRIDPAAAAQTLADLGE